MFIVAWNLLESFYSIAPIFDNSFTFSIIWTHIFIGLRGIWTLLIHRFTHLKLEKYGLITFIDVVIFYLNIWWGKLDIKSYYYKNKEGDCCYGELSKQFTDVITPIPFTPTISVAQLVGGFPEPLNVLTSYCPVRVLGKNMS